MFEASCPWSLLIRKEHMPLAHQNYLEWTPSRIISWAQKIGPQTALLVQKIIDTQTHPEHAYRSWLQRLLHNAKLKQQAALEDIDYKHPRGLNKQLS